MLNVSLCVIWSSSPSVRSQTLILSHLDSRQEHCESQMLRKRVKELETEYRQLQLECQVTESRVVELESEVEVSFYTILEWTCEFYMSSEPPVVLFGCVVCFIYFECVYFCVFVELWETVNHEIGYIVFLQMFCLVPRSETFAPHQSEVLLCGCLCCCRGALWSLISFWWRIFHDACRHQSQVFHKNIALEHAETVQRGQAEGILPVRISAIAAGSMFFEWLARSSSVCLCPLCFPKWVNLSMWGTLGGEPDALESHWSWSRWRRSHTFSRFVLCLDAGSGKVPACRERDGHAAVHPVSHAGESTTSGVQSERRDPHQAGPLLSAGRHSQTAGNRSRFLCLLVFVVPHHTFHGFTILVQYDWFWRH